MPFSTFLDGRPYTQLRGAAWLSLTDTGHVLAGSVTSDTGGGGTTVWTAGGTVPCRIDPLRRGGEEILIADRISERSTHLLRLPPGTTANVKDRFVIDGRGTFEILASVDRTREWIRTLEVVEAS